MVQRPTAQAPSLISPMPSSQTLQPLWPHLEPFPRNSLFYGDNLRWLRDHDRFPSDTVDLIYLDPPFNSNRSYNVLFKDRTGSESSAQIQAFDDTWSWGHESEELFIDLTQRGYGPGVVADALMALRRILGTNDLFAYLIMMTARLVELHRVLRSTGTLYLHCDPTASHYLKVILDTIFGKHLFLNEIVWRRTPSKSLSTQRFARNHDILLIYARSEHTQFNADRMFIPYNEADLDPKTLAKYSLRDQDGRRYHLDNLTNPNRDRPNLTYEFLGVTRVWRWTRERMQEAYEQGLVVQPRPGAVPRLKRYLDQQRGKPIGDVWTDIDPLNSQARERLSYPTQKPIALLERIIQASSNPGDVILDPFCGCGTTIDAAQRLNRRWIGIDITILAVDLIKKRIQNTFGAEVLSQVDTFGVPNELHAARHLFLQDPFEFERWAVTLVDGQPNERSKQRGDRGIDGVVRFPADIDNRTRTIEKLGRSLVSVKGGERLAPTMVRDLVGTVDSEYAEMGMLLTLNDPTENMRAAARRSGVYVWPLNGKTYPRTQIVTIEDLLDNRRPIMPTPIPPYIAAQRYKVNAEQLALFS